MYEVDVVKNNNKYFSNVVESYKVNYLRTCEEYLINKYFKGEVLVLGCGAGRTLRGIKNKGFELVGVDINEYMVREARATHPDIDVRQMDACDLKFQGNSFDTIFFPFHGIDYVHPNIYKAVAEIKRVLKPDGVFIMSSHNRFYLKRLNQFFDGDYADYSGLITYRTTFLDLFRLKKYFKKVKTIQRIKIAVSWKDANWKDFIYKLLPFFNKSTYFVCQGKK